ncbi:MAG: hypothetical protein RSB55_05205 [Oscillospiraceae bacterium]
MNNENGANQTPNEKGKKVQQPQAGREKKSQAQNKKQNTPHQ